MWRWFNTLIATNTFSENSAHILAGYAAVLTAARFDRADVFLAVGFCVVLAGLKEYAYDAHFETPHQTFTMNTTDFLGYVIGIALGLVIARV